jgi:Outer membrane protein beta-barrel domain
MQFIDNDIDDLYRRAAEDYPLNASGSDWNKVFNALNQQPEEERKRPFLFWKSATILTLVLTLPLLIAHNWHPSPLSRIGSTDQAGKSDVTSIAHKPTPGQDKARSTFTASSPANNPVVTANSSTNNSTSVKPLPIHKQVVQKIAIPPVTPKKKMTQTPARKPFNSGVALKARPSGSFAPATESQPESAPSSLTIQPSKTVSTLAMSGPLSINPLALTSDRTPIVKPSDRQKQPSVKTSHLYLSLMAGVDQSNIKMQKTSSPGYTTGVLATYQFSSRFSVEAGAFLDQKSYYTKGAYFKTKLYYNANIQSVDGTCQMIELPVQLKYRFGQSQDRYWYATTGLSSYLMKKENYDYTYTTTSTTPYEGYKSYRNSTNNWFSVLRVSGGYSRNIGRLGSIRIEPYLGLPLNGLGIGKLPITSAGLNIGLTRRLF